MNKKSKLSRILSKDITLMVISAFLALIIWFIINAGSDAEGSVPINDIPIKVELSEKAKKDGLQVFSGGDLTASVDVEGNKLTVGSLSASDIEVVPLDINTIDSPGYHKLKLKANKKGIRTNYSMSSPVPDSIEIFVDRYQKAEFEILNGVETDEFSSDYHIDPVLSESHVIIEGPETEVSSIKSVVVKGNLDLEVDETSSGIFDLVYLDKNGDEVELKMSKTSVSSVEVKMSLLPTKEVYISPDFVNGPSDFESFTVEPNRIKVAGQSSDLKNVADIISVDIDFAKIDLSKIIDGMYEQECIIPLPNGCKNISSVTNMKFKADFSGYITKKITIPADNFKTKNIDLKKYNVRFNYESIEVEVCGPSDLIYEITADDIVPTVDFSKNNYSVSKAGEITFEFIFTEDFNKCWVYGEHKMFANVSEK